MRTNIFVIIISFVLSQVIFVVSLRADVEHTDIDIGMPIGEALPSLFSNRYVMISTPLNYITKLKRADAFLLDNDKIIYVESRASKHGDTYKIVRMAAFNLKDINSVSIKNLVFFKNFDLGKFKGHN